MPTWLKWVLCGVVLVVLSGVMHAAHARDEVGLTLGLALLVWCGAGALIAARAVLRFLRR